MAARDFSSLSTAQIEGRLEQDGLPDDERDALVDELTRRLLSDDPSDSGTPPPRDERTTPSQGQEDGTRTTAASDDADEPSRRRPASERTGRRGRGARSAPAADTDDAATVGGHPPPAGPGGVPRFLASLAAALVVAAIGWGALTVITQSTPSDGGSDTTTLDPPVEPVDDPPVEPVDGGGVDPGPDTDSGSAPDGLLGPTGRVAVQWILLGSPYAAVITTDGPTGTAVVRYQDPQTGQLVDVLQDLQLQEDNGTVAYVGSNPRHPNTGQRHPTYQPDAFRLVEDGNGGLVFDVVCDAGGQCAPLRFVNLGG